MVNLPTKPAAFRSLEVQDWRQFEHVEIRFHPRLTVLTGANASGKSTLLGLLARHFNWSRGYSTAPLRQRSKEGHWVSVGRKRAREVLNDASAWAHIGSLTYGSGITTDINVPTAAAAERMQYDLHMPQQQQVTGAFLASHRSVSGNYAQVNTIPALFGSSEQLFEQFTNELRVRWAGSWTGKTPQLALKEALIAAAVFGGRGNEAVDPNPLARAVWEGFQEVLGQVMPPTIGFRRLRVRVPEVIVETETGDFILDDASGGLTAVIEMAWQIFLRSHERAAFTVLLDEPENHLHPSLQRELMPSLLRAFPRVQFIVATHSPFVVTATPESAVYALEYNKGRRVIGRRLDYANKAASADETLRRVLGVESTMPVWAEARFDSIVSRYLTGSVSPETLQALRRELKENGLEAEFPDALVRVADEADGDKSA